VGLLTATTQTWADGNLLRRTGARDSMVRVLPRQGNRLLVDAGLWPQADHDPLAPLELVRQPVLAI